MKKKLCLLAVFLLIIGFSTFGENEEEEIDYLLFLPNSSSQFVNEEQARVQLDNLAKYFTGREIAAGQINIYGYAAVVPNDIDPIVLSRNRALFIISELQRRGIQRSLFSDPVAYGEVALWGSNANEESRSPNRRVRVVLDGFFITVEQSGEVIESEVPPVVAEPEFIEEVEYIEVEKESIADKDKNEWKFPWWLLLPLLLLFLPFFLSKRKKGPKKEKPPKPAKPQKAEAPPPAPPPPAPPAAPFVANEKDVVAASTIPAGMAMPIAVMSTETGESVVYLEEEIRRRAYEHYINRNGENGTQEGDWYKALPEICAKYEAAGYKTYSDGSWWAQKTFSKKV